MKIKLTQNKYIYNYCEPYIIAELGANHNGDMDLAKKLIMEAKKAGADCVKFQSWTKDSVFARQKYEQNYFLSDDYRDRGDTTLEKIVEEYSISEDELLKMKKFADQQGIDCTSTPFSKHEADFLVDVLDAPFIKVASMDLNNYPFLEYLAKKSKPIVLSTGLSELYEIDQAIRTIEEAGNIQISVLHCVSIYPPKDEQVNLNNIETLQKLYPNYPIGFSDHTLGIAIPLASVAKGACIIEKHFTLDKNMPGWKADPYILRSAFSISKSEIWQAHMEAKKELINYVNKNYNSNMNFNDFTIGFARRQTAYKRPDLLISEPEKLKQIAKKFGSIQIIFAGKAHPKDQSGKDSIKKIFCVMNSIDDNVKIAFIHNYDIKIAKMMVAGVDLWLNTPRRPQEASGTSGMKAAHNGVPQFGTLDGWWLEGCIENITGWAIGPEKAEEEESDDEIDRNDLYDKLENWIMPKFYSDRDNWIRTMRSCIAVNASFFNTNRMIQQYVLNAYFR